MDIVRNCHRRRDRDATRMTVNHKSAFQGYSVMKRLLGIILVGGLGAGILFATGCASDGQTTKADVQTHAYSDGMMCPACETVWVTERTKHGPRNVNRLTTSREMTCPTCETTAQRVLLEDGTVQLHECPECKVTPMKIKLDPSPRSSFKGGRP